MEMCLLYTTEGHLTACCLCGGQLFSCTIKEGLVFPRYARPRNALPSETGKAQYLAPPFVGDAAFAASELYVHKTRPWEPQFLDIRSGEFYPPFLSLAPVPPQDEVYEPFRTTPATDEALLRAHIERLKQENEDKSLRLAFLSARLEETE